ncbi:MAG: lamin tail domain-containing protein, partial [Prevotellaceae bacterium]|nr:lamin tail domain-containing protein [Prevotellaceae bacterium]
MLHQVKKIGLLCTAASCLTLQLRAQVRYDFESGDLSGFLQNPDSGWVVKDAALLGEGKALQHVRPIASGSNAVDKISTIPPATQSLQSDTWRFTVAYASTTSTNNYWLAFLTSNVDASAMSATGAGVNAYAVGVYSKLNGDTLTLFKINSGNIAPLISSTITARGKKLAIMVTRSGRGKWTLFVNERGDASRPIQRGTAVDESVALGEYFGFLFAFTASNSGKFFADDVSIGLIQRPLKVASVRRKTTRSLRVELSMAVDAAQAAEVARYSLRTADGDELPVDSVALTSAKTVTLFVGKSFAAGSYNLTIHDLLTAQGVESYDSYDFLLEAPRYGDVVFSELMVRPYSENEFANEYVEFYNRTNHLLNLTGWTIATATQVGRITAGSIEASDYALIGSGVEMAKLDAVLGVVNRPTLTDGGATLTLADSCGTPVAVLTYSDSWYADEEKKERGGYSLEKIDLNNLEETAANWRASTDERGGTPGTENSVADNNADAAPPELLSCGIAGSELHLRFGEALNDATLSADAFALDNGMGAAKSLRWDAEAPMNITLAFDRPLERNVVYTLAVKSGAVCDLAQNCRADFSVQAGLGENPAAGEVVINEVLFDPYTGGVDFVELYNRSDNIAELEGLRIANRNTNNGVVGKSYPLPAYALFPRSYVVLTTLPDVVRAQYSCPNPKAFIALANLPSYPNEEGCVALLGSDG